MTPNQRHSGLSDTVLVNRKEMYQHAKACNPERWNGNIRNWDLPQEVYLNPEREIVKVQSA